MSEKESSVILAHKILEDSFRDPDADVSVLARQLLRREERLQRIADIALANSLLHIAKIARGEAI
jgi:hypothetical protein